MIPTTIPEEIELWNYEFLHKNAIECDRSNCGFGMFFSRFWIFSPELSAFIVIIYDKRLFEATQKPQTRLIYLVKYHRIVNVKSHSFVINITQSCLIRVHRTIFMLLLYYQLIRLAILIIPMSNKSADHRKMPTHLLLCEGT